jgi:hypothetical protein
MSDYCKQCSLEEFGKDYKELAGLSTENDTQNSLFATAICEGCGYIQVDHEGNCISEDCDGSHRKVAK